MTRPTIRSVAARAGVSKSLVSLVLQGSPKVSDERRAAVLAAMDELGYRPDPTAQSLAQGRTRAIGLVLDDLRNPWFVDVLEGLRPVLREAGLRPVLAESRSEPEAPRTFADLRVDGLVVIGTLPDLSVVAEVAETVPTVLAGTRLDPGDPLDVDVVAGDDAAGTRLAVEHVLALGHRRVAHVGGEGPVGRLRRQAFERAVADGAGEPLVELGAMTEDAGHRAGLALLCREDPPTAVVAANDAVAVGVLAAAADLGVDVPGRLSVVGYDDTSTARLRAVSLTSVDNSAHEVGRLAAVRLLARLADPGAPADLQLVAPRLVVRATTAPRGARMTG
ncbi:LacI family DNA-binding transcriptional regulator [Kineococcus rhizosphaerae]|uniref:LacI family transcriptional regulator n=1 Tax=Kineococcus rhizosphaerae TaxID=559628 RepID=A0A2T0QYM2_9ACTN|nr:LacI family DNA-binding transcriptional regulator [Kineococcus rhizosphaerae]PRY11400.1 LacI family transcriptional regulator [Kineococcus rhizosphaerae]